MDLSCIKKTESNFKLYIDSLKSDSEKMKACEDLYDWCANMYKWCVNTRENTPIKDANDLNFDDNESKNELQQDTSNEDLPKDLSFLQDTETKLKSQIKMCKINGLIVKTCVHIEAWCSYVLMSMTEPEE